MPSPQSKSKQATARPSGLAGLISPHLPGFEPRAGQEQMADAITGALAERRHLIVEAGTGTGKSLAYLVPLAAHTIAEEKRAVVSTYTKALQRQLVEKDLPFLQKNVFKDLRYALCLGSENYLCIRRLGHLQAQDLFEDESDEIRRLLGWAAETGTGVREDTPYKYWARVCRESDLCHGKACRHFLTCHYQRAREHQRRSHILVVNHHLYFANLASGRHVLPSFEMAVFDEAHELEDVASDYLGMETSSIRCTHLFNSLMNARGPKGRPRGLLPRMKWIAAPVYTDLVLLLETARHSADRFFSLLKERLPEKAVRIRQPNFIEDMLSDPLVKLGVELEGLAKITDDEEDARDLRAVAVRARAAAEATRAVLNLDMDGHVYFAERAGRSVRLAATPVDIAGMHIFDDLETAVYTSATLSTGGTFKYIKGRLGIENAEELILKSHFDYERQAVLYIGRDLPPPDAPTWGLMVIERIRKILEITRGRTLVLFTSYSLLNHAADAIEIEGVRILRQGEGESYRLVEELKADPTAALFGTYTFWQGIDLPGDALKCVVITRLPFAVPDEPLVQARMELLQAQGREPFVHYQVPGAALTLKQGFGRLIRTSTDTGAVAILDSRIATRPYGKTFLKSLPRALVTDELEEIRRHL